MYGVKNGQDEYSFFAPLSVHEQLKDKPKGTKFQLTRNASQRGKKLVTDYTIEFLDYGIKEEKKLKQSLKAMDTMKQCLKAMKTQQKFSNNILL